MELNRAAILAKVLTRDQALEARNRRDDAIRRLGLSDEQAYPGSTKFPRAMEVIIKYMEDLVEAKLSCLEAAYTQTRTAVTGETVVEASAALKSALDEIVSARVASWSEALTLNRQRTRVFNTSDDSALEEAKREISRHATRLHEKADAKLDVLLQSSLANSENSAPAPNHGSRTAVVLRVLIAFPSDVPNYRDLLTNVVHEWNDVHSMAEGVVLMPVKWETHAHPDTGDYPQGIINKQIVDSCDIVIGVFWSRLGTPTLVAESGTAEEIERLRSKGKRVLLYFSKEALPQSHDPQQWQKLKSYQQQLQSNTLYWEFDGTADLHRLASKHLASVVHELTSEAATEFAPAPPPLAISHALAKIEIRNLTRRVWPTERHGFTGVEYYIDIFNASETQSLECVRVELVALSPDPIGFLPVPLHIKHENYETREFDLNPHSTRQIDILTGPIDDPRSQKEMIIPHTVNRERFPLPRDNYRMTVRAGAKNATPVEAVFEVWIDEHHELQCVRM